MTTRLLKEFQQIPSNPAMLVTFSRIFLIPVFMTLVLAELPQGALWAAVVFGLAALTDGIDGHLARTSGRISIIGRVMDPIADKLLISSALLALVQLGNVSAWVAMIIIGREFTVSGLRILMAEAGGQIPPGPLGKTKTVVQITAILALILGLPGASALLWVAVVLTVFSALGYVAGAYAYLQSMDPPDNKSAQSR